MSKTRGTLFDGFARGSNCRLANAPSGINLRAFSFVDSSNIGTWLGTHAATSGADTLISLNNGDSITLKNVALASLHASDFIVSPHH